MKRILSMVLTVIMLTVMFCACEKEECGDTDKATESVKPVDSGEIVGSWYGESYGEKSTILFNADGTGKVINNDGEELEMTYTILSDTEIKTIITVNGEKRESTSEYKLDGDILIFDNVELTRQ